MRPSGAPWLAKPGSEELLDQGWREANVVQHLDAAIDPILGGLWQWVGWYGEELKEEEARKQKEREALRSSDTDIDDIDW